jgi:hypothetical protein
MGLNDAQEMLDAALADARVYEREIADLKQQLENVHRICDESEASAEEARRASEAENGRPSNIQAMLFVYQVREALTSAGPATSDDEDDRSA